MRETSWRTLMLMTTVLILVVIFQGTVRPYKPKTPLIGPAMGGPLQPTDPNQVPEGLQTRPSASEAPDEPAPVEPEPVIAVPDARPVWLNENLGDLHGTVWSAPLEPEDSDEIDQSSRPESADPNQSSSPVPE